MLLNFKIFIMLPPTYGRDGRFDSSNIHTYTYGSNMFWQMIFRVVDFQTVHAAREKLRTKMHRYDISIIFTLCF